MQHELNTPPSPAELVERWAMARTTLEQTIAHLTPAQMAAPSTVTAWAVKDHLIHLAMWAQGIGALLIHKPRWAAMGLDPAWVAAGASLDEKNAVIYTQHRNKPLSEVQAIFAASHAHVSAIIAGLDPSDLERPYNFFEERTDLGDAVNDPIWYWIAGNTFDHYAEHEQWLNELIERQGWQRSAAL